METIWKKSTSELKTHVIRNFNFKSFSVHIADQSYSEKITELNCLIFISDVKIQFVPKHFLKYFCPFISDYLERK